MLSASYNDDTANCEQDHVDVANAEPAETIFVSAHFQVLERPRHRPGDRIEVAHDDSSGRMAELDVRPACRRELCTSLRHCTGVTLEYRWSGDWKMIPRPSVTKYREPVAPGSRGKACAT